jgi:hypothetical protein
MPTDEIEEARGLLRQRWGETPTIMHAAWIGGELVGAGTCAATPHGLLLYGGATLARARGRGAHQALVRARWDEAVARGAPALITQGGAMSRPILERLGFGPSATSTCSATSSDAPQLPPSDEASLCIVYCFKR